MLRGTGGGAGGDADHVATPDNPSIAAARHTEAIVCSRLPAGRSVSLAALADPARGTASILDSRVLDGPLQQGDDLVGQCREQFQRACVEGPRLPVDDAQRPTGKSVPADQRYAGEGANSRSRLPEGLSA